MDHPQYLDIIKKEEAELTEINHTPKDQRPLLALGLLLHLLVGETDTASAFFADNPSCQLLTRADLFQSRFFSSPREEAHYSLPANG